MFAGCAGRLQWNYLCLWADWMWKVIQYAGHHGPSHTEGYYTQSIWAHLWEYSGNFLSLSVCQLVSYYGKLFSTSTCMLGPCHTEGYYTQSIWVHLWQHSGNKQYCLLLCLCCLPTGVWLWTVMQYRYMYNVGLRQVVECSSTRTVDNYSSTISRTRIFGRKKKIPVTWHCPGRRLPVPGRAPAAGMAPSVKMFPSSITFKLTTQKLGPNVRISVWLGRKMDYSAIFGF